MKILKSKLKQIIKEEYNALQTEASWNRNRERAREDRFGSGMGRYSSYSSPAPIDKQAMGELKPVYNAVRDRINAEQRSGPNMQITPEAAPVWNLVSPMLPSSKILQHPELVSAMKAYASGQIEIQELVAVVPRGLSV